MIDTGDTAWMMMSTALVLMMTPALGLFYAGLVRSKNTLNTFMMSMAALGVATICWAVVGYSLAFSGGEGGFIGNLDFAFLNGVGFEPREGTTIPQLLFMVFQGAFCILTVALVSGAVVERIRFGPYLIFVALWSTLVYPIMAHWVFGGGFLADFGTLDFAGGISVEMASGFSALAAALLIGARKDYGRQALLPHNSVLVLLGAGLLWFGWFGFNGGSGFAAGEIGVLAFTNTLLAPACTLVAWFVLDLMRGGKVTAVGAATAVVVGCVAITPAAGFISPMWAMVLGAIAAVPSYLIIVWRPRTRVDETLDVLGAHGVAGIIGMVFIGFFAQADWNGIADGLIYGNAAQLGHQLLAVAIAPVFAFVSTFVILKAISLVSPLRASEREEAVGMDVIQHGEEAYVSGEGALLIRVAPKDQADIESEMEPVQ